MTTPPQHMIDALRRMGLVAAAEQPSGEPLPGGVASDIWRIDLTSGPICIKCALERLKVGADWHVPVERNAYEVLWFEVAGQFAPEAVPRIVGRDQEASLFGMEFLDPGAYRVWKDDLRRGRIDPDVASAVGTRLAAIHAGTAGDDEVRARFATDSLFHAIRLAPYLEATARKHPDRAAALLELVETTARTKLALVHGDVSPKNIQIGPRGPVFLDAECAWYGDPAFDLAFCLNHLLLKCLWTPAAARRLLDAYGRLCDAYFAGVAWEPPAVLNARAAHLLPGLLLARIDGKSPVEYLTEEHDKARVRGVARALLADPVDDLGGVADAWREEVAT